MDYWQEKFTKVRVCGVECDFSDMRIDRNTVPKGKYQYEVADDDESQARYHGQFRTDISPLALYSCLYAYR